MAWKRRSPTPWAPSMSSSTDFRSLACAPQPGVSPAKHAGTRRSPADCDAPSARKSPPDQRHDPSGASIRSEEHTSELQSLRHLVCRLLLEKKKKKNKLTTRQHNTTNLS